MPAGRRAAIRRVAVLVGVASIAIVGSDRASAHRRDELLQAARIAVDRTHVELELDLTPGIAVAEAIVAGIDRDQDGSISSPERDAYIAQVVGAVALAVDGHRVALEPSAATFPAIEAMRTGEGTIQIRCHAALATLSTGTHRLVFRNQYRRDVSAYLANALEPRGGGVIVTSQERAPDQHDLAIDFAVEARGGVVPPWWVFGGVASVGLVAVYLTRPSRT